MNRIQIQEQLLQETKYSRWYLNIIENAKSQNRKKLKRSLIEYVYYENHHILPKSLFKDFETSTWNLVLLTNKEHVLCHKLLFKHYEKYHSPTEKLKWLGHLKLWEYTLERI